MSRAGEPGRYHLGPMPAGTAEGSSDRAAREAGDDAATATAGADADASVTASEGAAATGPVEPGSAVDGSPDHVATGSDDTGGSPGAGGTADRRATTRAFLGWGAASYLVGLGAVLAASLLSTGGRLVYVLDDPAIHLSVAENLARHGTWGVVPGHFESASSAPLWTVLLAAWDLVVPGPTNVAPLVLNVAASLAVIALLATQQDALRPGRRRPLDVAAVAVLTVVVLFLPGLTMVGMEHTLHAALVLAATILLHRRLAGRGDPGWSSRPGLLGGPTSVAGRAVTGWLPLVLLALATLTRFETAFVAAGICLAVVVLGRAWGVAVRVGLASALPLAGFGLANRLGGQDLLPNSVLAKTRGDEGATSSVVEELAGRFTGDPLVALLAGVLLVALLVAWQTRAGAWPRWSFPAAVYLVAVGLHVVLARIGWYERYQAYLVVLGVYAVLSLLGDTLPALAGARAPRRIPARSGGDGGRGPDGGGAPAPRPRPPVLVPGLVAVTLLFTTTKTLLTVDASEAVTETYQQRYQAGLFLDRYYDGEPVATGELGYISLFHDGPVTDLFGLGDHEVLRARLDANQHLPASYWGDLAERRGFDVVAAYPTTLWFDTPEDWILVGTWRIDADVITAFEPDLNFWATSPEAVAPLARHLEEFAPELPDDVEWHPNELAELRAAQLAGRTVPGPGGPGGPGDSGDSGRTGDSGPEGAGG
jgi:hypothetical protein